MAFILAWTSTPLNMLGSEFLFSSLDSEVLSFTPGVLNLLTPAGNEQQFSGTFIYDVDPETGEPDFIDGTITELAEIGPDSVAHYWAKELTLPLTTWSQFLLANDAAGLQAYVLSGADRIIGSQQDDVLAGYAGDDVFDGSIGNDTIYGGTGNDLAFLRGLKSNWQIVKADGKIVATDLTGNFGTDTLYDVERLQFDDQTVTVNHIPGITPAPQLPRGAASVAASSLFSIVDTDGDTITRYRFFDSNAGGMRFLLNGVAQAELANFEVTAAQLSGLQMQLGSPGYVNDFWLQVYDGYSWSDWAQIQLVSPINNVPVVSVSDRTPSHGTSVLAAAGLFSATDADGDPITRYTFFDGTAGGGHFRKNGVDQAEGANITVDATDLGTFDFVLGGSGDVLWVQAYDGTGWGAWKSFTVFPPQNNLPVVSINNGGLNPARGATTVAASSFFSASDADSDTITQYRFFDGTSGNGRFELNGNPAAELANVTINAGDLANFKYRVSGTGVGDTLWVQAFDGLGWSAWKSFNVAAPQNAAPTAAVSDRNPARGTSVLAAASLVSATDPDGDTITAYKFFDGTIGSGHFRKNGADQAEGVNIDVSAAELATTEFVLGGGSDLLWVQAFDGTTWSAWKSFNVFPPQNNLPVIAVNTGALNPAHGAATVLASSFFGVTDADNDTITQYRFFDGTAGNGSFELNGAPKGELTNVTINASDLANFRYRTSATGAGDTLWVQAFDGIGWGAWKNFNVAAPSNATPVVAINGGSLSPAHGTTTVLASSFFGVTDGDGDTITQYRFFDGTAGNGQFERNGAPQTELITLTVDASDLANFTYRVSGTGVGDTLWVQAYDGAAWSAWKSFNVAAPPNNAPVVTVSQASLSPAHGTATIAASSFFSVADADSDTITQFRFFDGTSGNGGFELNGGPVAELTNVTINAGDLANFRYRTSTTGAGDTLWVQAYDGTAWSAWKSFNVAAPSNVAPVVNVHDVTPGMNQDVISASTLFTVTDPDDATMVRYRFFDGTIGNGRFHLNGTFQAENQTITFEAADLVNFGYVANTGGGDTLWVQAFDGTSWSSWKNFNVAAEPIGFGSSSGLLSVPTVLIDRGNGVFEIGYLTDTPDGQTVTTPSLAPIVNPHPVSVQTGGVLSLTNLLGANDVDGDAVTQWQLWDATTFGGAIRVDGVAQTPNHAIDVMANQLASVEFVAAASPATDLLWARAFGGGDWGAWKPFTVQTFASSS